MNTESIQIIFWISIAIILYTYVGYGAILYILAKIKSFLLKKREVSEGYELPAVTLIVAAYNEERFIKEKIENTLALDYPKEKLEIFIVTDGSNDATPEIVGGYPGIQLFHSPERKGKNHAVNRVMKHVKTPITVFSDSNTMLNPLAIKNMVRHYRDEKVGGVAGEKRIVKKEADSASSAGEGFYWQYESFLKKKDYELHSVVGAAGELFSVRTALFEPAPHDMIIEDFYVSMRIVAKGFRFAYEPDAFATETGSASITDEWKRKVRISAGGLQAIVKFGPLLNPFHHGMVSFQYISHRVLRWTLAPLALFVALVTNAFLAFHAGTLYVLLFNMQLFFYGIAIIGYYYRSRKIMIKGFFVPYYFVMMNASVYAGFARAIRKKQSVVWEKSQRA